MAFELFDVVIAFRFGDLIDVNDFSANLKAWFCVCEASQSLGISKINIAADRFYF